MPGSGPERAGHPLPGARVAPLLVLFRFTLSSASRRFPVSVVVLPFADSVAARAFADGFQGLFALAWPDHGGDDLTVSVTRLGGTPRKPDAREDDDD
jgi:hypothetical protein